MLRYENNKKELSKQEIDRQRLVINSISELLIKLNPTTKNVIFTNQIIDKILITLIDIYSIDLKVCNERVFYP
jgi:hypothetical protein